MRELIEEIRKSIANLSEQNCIPIESMGDKNSWVYRSANEFGVAILYNGDEKIDDHYNNLRLNTFCLNINGENKIALGLSSSKEDLRSEFAVIACEFVNQGNFDEGENYVINNPYDWWDKWKALFGNVEVNSTSSSIFAELLVFCELLNDGKEAVWGGSKYSTCDIEMKNQEYEVKSTLSRYNDSIIVSSQFQLDKKKKDLYLVFVKLEKVEEGICIDDLLDVLDGSTRMECEKHLEKMNKMKNSRDRKERFKILDVRKYKVDDNFPVITNNSFKDNVLPTHIEKITYSINLDGLSYENFELKVVFNN